MKDQITKIGKERKKMSFFQTWPYFGNKYLIFLVFGREQKWIREKKREREEEEEEEEKRRRKKEEGRGQEIKSMNLYGFLWILVWNLLGTFVGILYGFLV